MNDSGPENNPKPSFPKQLFDALVYGAIRVRLIEISSVRRTKNVLTVITASGRRIVLKFRNNRFAIQTESELRRRIEEYLN